MKFHYPPGPLCGGVILRDNIHAQSACLFYIMIYEKTFQDLLICDDITRSFRHSSVRIPVEGGMVSTPFIKNSSYVKVAFLELSVLLPL